MSHHRIDPIKYIELKQQADESIEIEQQCLVPINNHIYEDKFWCEFVTKNVGQVKNVIIYGRVISDNSITIMRESSIIQIINFSSLMVKRITSHFTG